MHSYPLQKSSKNWFSGLSISHENPQLRPRCELIILIFLPSGKFARFSWTRRCKTADRLICKTDMCRFIEPFMFKVASLTINTFIHFSCSDLAEAFYSCCRQNCAYCGGFRDSWCHSIFHLWFYLEKCTSVKFFEIKQLSKALVCCGGAFSGHIPWSRIFQSCRNYLVFLKGPRQISLNFILVIINYFDQENKWNR